MSSLASGDGPPERMTVRQAAEQAVRPDRVDDDASDRPEQLGRRIDLHRLRPWRLAGELAGPLAGLLQQHVHLATDHSGVERRLLMMDERLQAGEALRLHRLGDLFGRGGRGRARAWAVFEGEGRGIADLLDDR